MITHFRRAAVFACCALLGFASAVRAQENYDRGRFLVYENGVPVAHEEFDYDVFADSIVVHAESSRKLRSPEGRVEDFRKNMAMIADGFDFGIRRYASNQIVFGRTDVNGYIPPDADDTTFTAYMEDSHGGEAFRLAQPPGRMFIIDSQLYTLFDVIARVLARQTFDARPVSLLSFGQKPEVIEATARAMPPDTMRWLGRRLIARRVELADASARFALTIGPDGTMLRLVQPEAGIEVLREEPAAKRPKRRPPR